MSLYCGPLLACSVFAASVVSIVPSEARGNTFEVDVATALASKRSTAPEASLAIIDIIQPTSLPSNRLTLSDVLRFVPGFDVVPAFWYRSPGARGISGSVNFMIDGVTATSPIDYRYPGEYGLFLEEFKQIEIISGPAGVPWGAYSFLGVVNATTRSNTGRTEIKTALGERGLHRHTVSTGGKLFGAPLTLFAGFASQKNPVSNPGETTLSIPPYGLQFDVQPNDVSTDPKLNTSVVLSARLKSGSWTTYARVPVSVERYQVSEFGSVLLPGSDGTRAIVEPMAYISYQKAFLDGALGVIARGVWQLFAEDFEQALFEGRGDFNAIRGLRRITLSRASAVVDVSYRFRARSFASELSAGANLIGEIPHSSSFSTSDSQSDGAFAPQGDVLTLDAVLTGSVYAFEELKLLNRLSLGAGFRHNFGGVAYDDITLLQLNAAFRFADAGFAKFSLTQGMRPPQLVDRQGVFPVVGSKLEPEQSEAIQIEANTTFDEWWILKSTFLRASLASTDTSQNIVREGLRFVPFQQRPVNIPGFSILTLALQMKVEFRNDWKLRLGYSRNVVSDARVDEPDELLGPACRNESREPLSCANHGPHDRFVAELSTIPFRDLILSVDMAAQCGGRRAVFDVGLADETQTFLGNVTDMPCFAIFGAAVTYPANIERVAFSISGQNLGDTRLPVSYFAQPELGGAQANLRQIYGRSVFGTLTILFGTDS